MTRLEARYRRLLGLLPAWYRAHREQEMVDVFLTDRDARGRDTGELDAEYGWPGWGEAASVAGLALRTRIGGPGDPPGPRAVGGVVRAAALWAVLLSAAGAATSIVLTVVAALIGPPELSAMLEAQLRPTGLDGWWSTTVLVLGLCWLPAWTALASGRRTAALLLACAATLPALVSLATSVVEDTASLVVMVLATVALDVAAVVLLALGFHRDAPPAAVPRQWSMLGVAVLVLLAAAPLVPLLQVLVRPQAAVLLLAALALAVSRRPRPAVSGGLAVVATVVAVCGLLELAVVVNEEVGPALTAGLGLAAALVAVVAARRPARQAVSPG